MRTTYKVLAYAIAVLIVVQAAAIAFALAGLGSWVQDGGVLDKALMENEEDVPGFVVGLIVHGMNGQLLIPLLALVLLVVSFFAKINKGVALGAAVFGLVVVQVLLGMFSRGAELPLLGMVHGANAFVLFTVVVVAARRARRVGESAADQVAVSHRATV